MYSAAVSGVNNDSNSSIELVIALKDEFMIVKATCRHCKINI